MSTPQLEERIAQFRKMAEDDPDNELGHFRLGQLLMEAGNEADAAPLVSTRTLVLSPAFSKVYQLLAQCQLKLGRRDEAVGTLNEGFKTADTRGDKIPPTKWPKCSRNWAKSPRPPKGPRPRRPAAFPVLGRTALPAGTENRWPLRRFRTRLGN